MLMVTYQNLSGGQQMVDHFYQMCINLSCIIWIDYDFLDLTHDTITHDL